MTVSSYTQKFQPRAVTISYRSSMELKIRFFNNPSRLDIAYQPTPEYLEVFADFFSQMDPWPEIKMSQSKYLHGTSLLLLRLNQKVQYL